MVTFREILAISNTLDNGSTLSILNGTYIYYNDVLTIKGITPVGQDVSEGIQVI